MALSAILHSKLALTLDVVVTVGFQLDWPNLIVGMILGFIVGYIAAYLAHASYDRRQSVAKARVLRQKYGKLARTYSNVRADGSATGEEDD